MMLRLAIAGAAMLALASPAAMADGKKKRNESWGKAGVSFVDYTADSLTCANQAYGVDVKVKPYGPLGTGWNDVSLPPAVWTKLTPGDVLVYTTTYVEGYKHAARLDVVEQLQTVVDGCLTGKGYSKFQLTGAQMQQLRTLKMGSEERARFLYSLGSDANVLQAQGVRTA
jgi:hypothetical protein